MFQAPDVLWTIHCVSNDYSQLAGNTCEEDIRFRGGMVAGFSSGNTHIDFKVANSTFHDGSDFVSVIPFVGITLNTREHTQFHVFIGVSGSSFFSRAAGILTFTMPLAFYVTHLRASPFDAVSPTFLFCDTKVFHGKRRVFRAGRVTVLIVTDLFEGAFIAWIVGDKSFGKMEIME